MENNLIVTLIVGIAGLFLGIVNSWILYFQYKKDRPNIIIEKIKCAPDLPHPKEPSHGAIRVCIKNIGYRKAYLTKISVYIKTEEKTFWAPIKSIKPEIPLIIPELEQREVDINFLLVSKKHFKEIKEKNPIKIDIKFNFPHKSITIPFLIGKKGLKIKREKSI